MSIKLRD